MPGDDDAASRQSFFVSRTASSSPHLCLQSPLEAKWTSRRRSSSSEDAAQSAYRPPGTSHGAATATSPAWTDGRTLRDHRPASTSTRSGRCPLSLDADADEPRQIVRTEYAEPMYSKLAQEAIELWQDPLFADVFHKTGWIAGTTSPRPDPARPRQSPPPGTLNVRSVEPSLSPFLVDSFDRAVENTFKYGDPSGITKLESREELRASEWGKYFSGMEDYRGIHNSNAGWVAAAEALAVVGKECKRLGVEFVHGVMTEVVKGDGGKVVGVVTEDGKTLKADKVVLALGAYTDSVLDMEGQTLGVSPLVSTRDRCSCEAGAGGVQHHPRPDDGQGARVLRRHARHRHRGPFATTAPTRLPC